MLDTQPEIKVHKITGSELSGIVKEYILWTVSPKKWTSMPNRAYRVHFPSRKNVTKYGKDIHDKEGIDVTGRRPGQRPSKIYIKSLNRIPKILGGQQPNLSVQRRLTQSTKSTSWNTSADIGIQF